MHVWQRPGCGAVIIKGSIAGIKVTSAAGSLDCSLMQRTRRRCVCVCVAGIHMKGLGREKRTGVGGGRVVDMYSVTQLNIPNCWGISGAFNTFQLKQIFRARGQIKRTVGMFNFDGWFLALWFTPGLATSLKWSVYICSGSLCTLSLRRV